MGLLQRKPGKKTQSVARYVQKLSAGGSEKLPRCDCGEWETEVGQVLGCLAFQTAVRHDAELVLDSLGCIKPMQLSVQQPRQASVVLHTTDDTGSGIKHSLYIACPSSLSANPPRQRYNSQCVTTRKREQVWPLILCPVSAESAEAGVASRSQMN